eukprot:Seg212.5 transcript_id=Seg212.5/GoldUCD/mRNA.D3Y31 product="Coiled-coil and C2 domain-containing protein 1-like" protein_id=Seg212.5/GoldUCD/D3Y31
MFGGKKGKDTRKRGNKSDDDDVMKMFGLGMPQEDDDEDDESLEAELAALQGRPVQKKKQQKKDDKLMSLDQIQQLASASLRDVEDEDMSDDDIDEDDLLEELQELVPDDEPEVTTAVKPKSPPKAQSSGDSAMVTLLTQRKEGYVQACANAKSEGASSKVRRMERGIKELDKLLKDARAGKTVKEDDIPPQVFIKSAKDTTSQQQPQQDLLTAPEPMLVDVTPVQPTQEAPKETPTLPTPKPAAEPVVPKQDQSADSNNKKEGLIKAVTARRDEYKMAALAKKREGDIATAKNYLLAFKQIDQLVKDLSNGKDIDLSLLPASPGEASAAAPTPTAAPTQAASTPAAPQPSQTEASAPPKNTGPPPAPSSILEALQQRLDKYQQASDQAKAEGNGGKARRMGRIAKQYQDAIRDHKKGKAVNYDELPCPPDFPPIPVPGGSKQAEAPGAAALDAPAVTVVPPQLAQASHAQPEVDVKAGSSEPMSRNQKELQFLLTRQKEFKMAALQAKKDGDIDSAKEYLRKAKGMDEMVVAAQSGLRVDITTVPSLKGKEKKASTSSLTSSPGDKSSGVQSVAIADDNSTATVSASSAELYARLEAALRRQIKTSKDNSEHYRLLGDLSAAKNFDTLHRGSQQDLDALIVSKNHGSPVPKFHYEMKSFPIVKSHPELSDSELEITIVRCINIPLASGYQPKDMYTYVNYEFPFPSDSPQTGSTNVVKSTINPEFNQSFKVSIDRKSRALQRVLKRQPLNLKLMYERGFLKSDKGLGQANIKLEHFSNRSTIHECVELMDLDRGRKAAGGKIEVMVKIREPFVDKDVEIVNEKWLVLDSHLRTLQIESSDIRKSLSASRASDAQKSPSTQRAHYKSLEVAKFEKDLTEKQIAACKAQGKGVPSSLTQKLENCIAQIQEAQAILKTGGNTALEYMKQLKTGIDIEKGKAQKCLQNGEKTEAKLCLARKKIIEKEHSQMQEELMLYQFGGLGC